MSDRLTQLQICLDQLIEQFNATINYVNNNSEPALLDEDEPKSIINLAAQAPVPQQQQQNPQQDQISKSASQPPPPTDPIKKEEEFENTLTELSTDLILKSRQINMLIDSLPGIGSTPEYQLELITNLNKELQQVEQERIEKIKEKDELLKRVESLIETLAIGITKNKM